MAAALQGREGASRGSGGCGGVGLHGGPIYRRWELVERAGHGGRRPASISAAINGARRCGVAARAVRRHRATGRVGQGPSGAARIPGTWSAWAHRELRVQRMEEAREGGP